MLPFSYARIPMYVLNHHILGYRLREIGRILIIALNWGTGDYCLLNPGLDFPCVPVPLVN